MPNYVTQTSISMGVAGPMHQPTYYRQGNVSLHPFQRQGVVGQASHQMAPPPRREFHAGLGAGAFPAGHMDMTLPPIVPFTTNPNQGDFQV